jgi:Concanavalin A-like lectin/glucanases superfamily
MALTAPTDFEAEARNTGAYVTWTAPPTPPGDLPLTGYQVTATRSDGSVRIFMLPADSTSAELAGLENCEPPLPAYSDLVMSYGPLWYLRFENPASNVDTASHFTVNNGYGDTTDRIGLYPSASPGRARTFPGGSALQLAGSATAPMNNSCTLAGAFTVVGGGTEINLVSGVSGAINVANTIYFGFTTTGVPHVRCWDGVADATFNGPASLIGAPHHVMWRWNSSTFDVGIWVDGVRVVTGNNGRGLRVGTGQRMVGGTIFGERYKGVMDEVSWYERALSDDEIAALYESWAEGN